MAFIVKETRREAPIRLLVYGDGGVGKSTLGASAPRPMFIAPEDGLVNIDARAVEAKTWTDILGAIEFISARDDVDTLVVDSLDWAEPLCWAHTCSSGAKKYPNIEAFGYGKGYTAALDQWRVFLHKLSGARSRGKNIVLVAHAIIKTFSNPEGDDFSRWQIKLHEKAAGLVKEWVDIVGFAQKEFSVYEDEQTKRTKGISTGKRVLRTDGTAAFDAKTRYAMPKSIPLEWSALERAIRGGDTATVISLRSEVEKRIQALRDDEVEGKVRAFLKERGETTTTLTEAIARLDVTIAEQQKAS